MQDINRLLRSLPWLGTVLVLAAGCGRPDTYPVNGKVVYPDGKEATELVGGIVILDPVEGTLGARGGIGPDGSFRAGTHKLGDGAQPGKYRVAVRPGKFTDEGIPLPLISKEYFDSQTSGIEITVEEKTNVVTFTVKRGKLAQGKN